MLPSSHIADVEKSMRYAEESDDRIIFNRFAVTMVGDHRNHVVAYDEGAWSCDCEGFDHHGYCSHTMTMERVLGEMVRLGEIELDKTQQTAEAAIG